MFNIGRSVPVGIEGDLHMSWTDERIALLTRLWGEGKTAAEIASALGNVTRNAVIGKAHRLKLSNRVSPIQQNKKPLPTPANMPGKMDRRPVESVASVLAEQGKGIKLTDLESHMCRWPFGDPRDENFGFCGASKMSGVPYCEEHTKVAYQAASRNRILKAKEFEERHDKDADTDEQDVVKAAVRG